MPSITYSENPDYDIDSPPKESRPMLNKLVESVRVDSQDDANLFSPAIAQAYKFATTGDYAKPEGPFWILVWESVGIVREDGNPFSTAEALPLKSKAGKWLGEGQAQDVLAKQFNSLGVTGSWGKVGQPDSAVGRVFEVKTNHEVLLFKRGKDEFKKKYRVFPTAVMAPGYTFDGEVRVYTKDGAGSATPETPAMPEVPMFSLTDVAEALRGRKTKDAADALMDAGIPGVVEGERVLDMAFGEAFESLAKTAGLVVDEGVFV